MQHPLPYNIQNAVILAAGMATRFQPQSLEKPKGLFRVRGEILIERQICQLQEAGIKDITVVTGYKKELFSYLKEEYGVSLIVNDAFEQYNNSVSLLKAAERIGNTYLCSSDNYFTENIFAPAVEHAFYSAVRSDDAGCEYIIETDADGRIMRVTPGEAKGQWYMCGPACFTEPLSKEFLPYMQKKLEADPASGTRFWEDFLIDDLDRFPIWIKKHDDGIIREFDTLEETRRFDPDFDINQAFIKSA